MFIQLFAWEDTVQDLFFETVAFQRIALVAKLMATADCSEDEKDVALAWALSHEGVFLIRHCERSEAIQERHARGCWIASLRSQ